ncbi:DUF697 domain-containing protein [Streptococcus sp. UBA3373]|uniref:DUF697 domain-containing protein n=1 Tax=Streptococcus sp. UBA3373 TaxID=1947562 RepID=UPI0025FA0DD3|nr:DUF697 domain-containing protein [Streptococcus sp. UBA3373]
MKRKTFWYLVGIGSLILLFLIILSSILQIGERLSKINIWLEIAFYILASLLVLILIIYPIIVIVFSPSFNITTTLDKDSLKNRRTYKTVAKNLAKYDFLKDYETRLLNFSNYDELRSTLNEVYRNEMKKHLNRIIIDHAKTVMISTAISQNGKLDMFSVLSVNLQMIKKIVCECGFRPSMKNLSKLSINVLSTALIADGLENINLEDVLPNSTMNAIAEIPFIKPLTSSIMQGVSNALLTIRIGLVARRYLFNDSQIMTKNEIRKYALIDSLKLLPIVITEVINIIPNKIVKVFSKKPKEEDINV